MTEGRHTRRTIQVIKKESAMKGLMHRWSPAAVILFILMAMVSCSSSIPQELNNNEKLWKDQGLKGYDFTLSRQCFCPENLRGPVEIRVRDGVANSITYSSNGTVVMGDEFKSADTIDKLFTLLEDAYAGTGDFEQKADAIDVTYDSQLGYPTRLFIDVSRSMADEEQGYTVTSLVAR